MATTLASTANTSTLATTVTTNLTTLLTTVVTTITSMVPSINSSDDYYDVLSDEDYDESAPCVKGDTMKLAAHLVPPLYLLVFLFGLLGNLLVIIILLKYMKLKNMTNIFLLNMAISDLLFLLTLPFWMYYIGLYHEWTLGIPMCKLLRGICYMALYGQVFFIILLTIDRYRAVVYAVSALRFKTVTSAGVTSLCTWLLAGLLALPEFFFHGHQDENGKVQCDPYYPELTTDILRRTHVVKMTILSLVLPLIVMVVCYWGIIKRLLQRPSKKKNKAIRLIFVIMVAYFVFWAPYNIVLLLSTFHSTFLEVDCDLNKRLDITLLVAKVIAYTHCCINPVIYAFVGERFQKNLHHFFHTYVAIYLCKYIPFLSGDGEGKEGPTRI
uniref:E1 variant a n=1 Tax=Equid gammaherpesvirus 2 TaxID=12657 RepID=A3F186_9GAMA|nr:E1 variant a [Equid gammaherpesvirus 2]ABN14176.1 E1 variant a [Equid gammaherpesvirus 2]